MSAAAAPVDLSGLAVVVVSFGSSGLLRENLAASDLAGSGAHVVVVDNPTTDAERDRVARLAHDHGWSLVGPDRNLGFGGGTNAGVAHARRLGHDVFLLLNPDAWITADAAARLLAAVRRDPTAMVSPVIVRPDGRPWFRGAWVDVEHGRTRQADRPRTDLPHPWLPGTCLVVHEQLWQATGGFDERYFLYWEDVDLSWRCPAAGGHVEVHADVRAVHSVGGTQVDAGSGTAGKSPTYYYWNCRNRLLFASQHLPRRDVLRWVLQTPRYAREVLLRGGRRQLLRPLRPVSAVVRGSAAGLWLVARAQGAGRRTEEQQVDRGATS